VCIATIGCGHAATFNYEWAFDVSDANPALPDVPPSSAPVASLAGATMVNTAGQGWIYNPGLAGYPVNPPITGSTSIRGIWEIDGSFNLHFGIESVSPGSAVSYTLKVVQYIDNLGLFPGTMSFTLAGTAALPTLGPTTIIEDLSAQNFGGRWVQQEFDWVGVTTPSGELSLTIAPPASPGVLSFDKISMEITGQALVPEPTLGPSFAAIGCATFGVWSWLRRRRAA